MRRNITKYDSPKIDPHKESALLVPMQPGLWLSVLRLSWRTFGWISAEPRLRCSIVASLHIKNKTMLNVFYFTTRSS